MVNGEAVGTGIGGGVLVRDGDETREVFQSREDAPRDIGRERFVRETSGGRKSRLAREKAEREKQSRDAERKRIEDEIKRVEAQRRQAEEKEFAERKVKFGKGKGEEVTILQQVSGRRGVEPRTGGVGEKKRLRPRTAVGTFLQSKTGGVEGARRAVEKISTVEKGTSGAISPVLRPIEKGLAKSGNVVAFATGQQRSKTQSAQPTLAQGSIRSFAQAQGTGVARVVKEVRTKPIQTAVDVAFLRGFRDVRTTVSGAEKLLLSRAKDTTVGVIKRQRSGEVLGKAVTRRTAGTVEQITSQEFLLTKSNRIVAEKIQSQVFKEGQLITTRRGTSISDPIGKGFVKLESGAKSPTTDLFKTATTLDGNRVVKIGTSAQRKVTVDGKQFIKGVTFQAKKGVVPITINQGKDIVAFQSKVPTRLSGRFVFREVSDKTTRQLVVEGTGPTRTVTKTVTQKGLGTVTQTQQVAGDIALSKVSVPRPAPAFVKAPTTQTQTIQKTSTINLVKPSQTVKQKENQFNIQSSKVTTIQGSRGKSALRTSQISEVASDKVTRSVTKLGTVSGQRQQFRQLFVRPSLGKSGRGFPRPTLQPNLVPEETLIPFAKLPRRIVKGKKRRGLAVVEVKTKGKFKTVGVTGSVSKAIDIGASITGRTLSATFRVKGEGNLKTPKGFKQTKQGVFVEKRSQRLSSPTERKAIRRARRRSKKR